MPTATAPDLTTLRADLASRLDEIELRLHALNAPDVRSGGGPQNDDSDFAAEHIGFEEMVAARSRLLVQRRELEAAIGRMDEGTWGVCESCDRQIAARRLEALPTATLCRPCAEQIESRATRALHARDWSVEDFA